MIYIKNLIRNNRHKSILLIISVTICNILALVYNYSFKFVIDAVQIKDISATWKAFLLVLTLQIAVTVFTLMVYDYYLRILQKSVEKDVRINIVSEILTWPFSKSKKITAGNLSTLMTNDAMQIGQYVSLYDFMIFANSIRFVITYVLLFSLDKIIGLVVLASVPLYYFLTKFTMEPMRKFVKAGYQVRDELNNSFLDLLKNLINIKSYKIEDIIENNIKNKTIELYEKEKNLQRWTAIFYFIRNFLSSFMPVIILGISIVRIINGQMTIGTLIAVNGFLGAIYLPISEIFQFRAMKNNLEPVVERIEPIVTNVVDKNDKRELKYGEPQIAVENLTYSFGENEIINNINVNISGCGLYRINGDNGKGKSTFFNIIAGLYNDFDGRIVINLRKDTDIVYMNQNDDLFNSSINDNITLFNKHKISTEYLQMIDKFSNKVNTISEFSGGEKRLFLFIRAVNSNASIFLFDEPFEGVDKKVREQMKDIISTLSKENLVLIINHNDKDFESLEYKNIKL